MSATTPRRSTRIPHTHTPKMSERKKGLFQREELPSRESLTTHRKLPVVDSESDSEDCDLGIISTLDSSSDENDQNVPKTPERSLWREYFLLIFLASANYSRVIIVNNTLNRQMKGFVDLFMWYYFPMHVRGLKSLILTCKLTLCTFFLSDNCFACNLRLTSFSFIIMAVLANYLY